MVLHTRNPEKRHRFSDSHLAVRFFCVSSHLVVTENSLCKVYAQTIELRIADIKHSLHGSVHEELWDYLPHVRFAICWHK